MRATPPRSKIVPMPMGFRPDGSWGPYFDAALTALAWQLCARRRATADPPAAYVRALQDADYTHAMPNAATWGRSMGTESWVRARCGTSLEQTIWFGGLAHEAYLLPDGRIESSHRIIHRPLSADEQREASRLAQLELGADDAPPVEP